MAVRSVVFLLVFQWIAIQTSHTKEMNIKHRDMDDLLNELVVTAHHLSRLFLPLNLINVLQKSQRVRGKIDCVFACLSEPWCHSMNLKNTPEKDGRHVCEVMSSDKYNSSKHFISDKEFTHLSIKSPCEDNPCGKNGTCIALYNKQAYHCACAAGFTGKRCLTDVDECAANSHNCHPNATCTNTQGSHNCTCKRGLYGNGTSCVQVKQSGLDSSRILTEYGNSSYLNSLYGYLSPVLQNHPLSQWINCWRAGRDGWAASTFHSLCDNKGPTVTIVRVGNYVFGGYADKSWNTHSGYTRSSSSFLYTLYNTKGYYPIKLTLTGSDNQHAIYRVSGIGPTFGGGPDLYIANVSNQNSQANPSTYSHPGFYLAGTQRFTPSDVEVFYETT